MDKTLKKEDQLQLKYLMKILQQCPMIKQMNISNLSLVRIAEFTLGYIVSCECVFGEILILPSMETYFQIFKCRDCQIPRCATIRCHQCIDEENLYFDEEEPKQYDKSYPPNSCATCDDDAPICSNCLYFCKSCLDYYCKQHHLRDICSTCESEYCPLEEVEFSTCIGCNQTSCSCCKLILCSYFGKWINCVEYNACKLCYSSNIMQHYQDPFRYRSFMKITNMLKNKYLSMPIHIIQIIAMFLNNPDDCDVSQQSR